MQIISMSITKISEEKRDIILPGNSPKSLCIYYGCCIRISCVPACKFYIIVRKVSCIPSKYHITKTKTFFYDGFELFKADKFSAQYSINISDSKFYFFSILFNQQLQNISV